MPMVGFAQVVQPAAGGASAYAVDGNEPEVVLDFPNTTYWKAGTAQASLSDVATFARASVASYTDSNGDIQEATSGTARVAHHVYNGSSWVNKGLLLESAAATNLFVESNDFTTGWTNTLSVDSGSFVNGPLGTNSMANLVDDNSTGTGTVFIESPSITVSTSTTYTVSVWSKANALSWLFIATQGFTTPGNVASYFNLSTGAVGTAGSGHTLHIEDFNGIYRCSITFTTDASDTTGTIRFGPADGDTDNVVDLDGTSSIYISGADFAAGDFPSSHIPTAGSTVTRAAETLQIPAANMTANTTGMSLVFHGTMNYADNSSAEEVVFMEWKKNASNYILNKLDTNGARTGQYVARQREAASGLDDVDGASDEFSPGINVDISISSRHTSSALNGASAGTANTANTTVTALADLSAENCDIGLTFTGTVDVFVQFDVDIGDSGIATASNSASYPA